MLSATVALNLVTLTAVGAAMVLVARAWSTRAHRGRRLPSPRTVSGIAMLWTLGLAALGLATYHLLLALYEELPGFYLLIEEALDSQPPIPDPPPDSDPYPPPPWGRPLPPLLGEAVS